MTYELRPEGLDFLARAPRSWRFEAGVAAPRPTVFGAISGDPSKWKSWFPGLSSGRYEGDGPPGVGSVRQVRMSGVTYRETVVAWVQDERWAYRVDQCSVPMARALVEEWATEDAGEGTLVRWTFAIEPGLLFRLGQPLAPTVMGRLFRRAMAKLSTELASRERG
jgi:carbon monoxide dehydrogenase subunit G